MLPDLSRPVAELAPLLLGCVVRHESEAGPVALVLTEVEAYDGENDRASHAYRGHTERNAVMFGRAGRLYVYRSHGLHWCANIVTGSEGTASAVLLRAGRVIDGADLARVRRGERVEDRRLARGPGNLCQALGITAEHNGAELTGRADLSLTPGKPIPAERVLSGPRVGVSRGHDEPWRFWIAGEPSVSAYRLSPRAPK
ncbi:MAG: DNA-3-methyladenine glycosylase [Nocardioidaceae bacterium]